MSDMFNMTQFKDKSETKGENVGVGLFDYPVLMAADILLYDAELVPVGEDQVQHVELTRDLAKRFNNNFGPTFKIPEAKILKQGARIMGLDDPTKKMSKSAKSEYNYIALTDDPEVAAKKIMKATTDSEGVVKYDVANKPGVSNLLVILSLLNNKKIEDLEKEFIGKGYGDFKKAVAEEVKVFLTKFQKKYYSIDNKEVLKILENGSKNLQKMATIKINDVKKKIGVI
jgi:tryptophanyl-tRNA synthetase